MCMIYAYNNNNIIFIIMKYIIVLDWTKGKLLPVFLLCFNAEFLLEQQFCCNKYGLGKKKKKNNGGGPRS